ncbi:hypothetical protein FFF34_000815 [Inquilinus sp. KBS0705]|nr:hypothetical protein FFF34_000815 [Inquilinus sp. KBS0705]
MDVGYFISELLGQQGEVSVPGLGYFAHTRVNGYYNEAEGKFYPPNYNVHFHPQPTDDSTLAQFIAERKNISLASSKYFTEKYVSSIKQQATAGEVKFADMGWFYISQGELLFRPNSNTSTDPEFFGLHPVKIYKLGKQPAAQTGAYVTESGELIESEALQTETPAHQFATDEEHEEYLLAYSKKKRRKAIWAFVILTILVGGGIYILINKFDPSEIGINQLIEKPLAPKAAAPVKKKVAKRDTIIQVGDDTSLYIPPKIANDSTAKAASAQPNVLDIPFPRYEIMGGAFRNKQDAEKAIADYATRGITASIAQFVPGPRVHVTLGTYRTKQEATKAIAELKKNKKLKEAIYTQQIKGKI